MNNYESYADVLESYMIAEEGILSGIKAVGKMAWKGLLRIIEIIKTGLNHIREKLRKLLSRKKKNTSKESKKETINRLEEEKAKLEEKLNTLTAKTTDTYNKLNDENTKLSDENKKLRKDIKDRDEDSYFQKRHNYQNITNKDAAIARLKEENSKNITNKDAVITGLKEEIAKKDKEIKSLKAGRDFWKEDSSYTNFERLCMTFISHVSMQNNKAYTALPKLINEAKKYDGVESRRDIIFKFSDKIEASVPTMASGGWSNTYKTIKYSYLPAVRENKKYLEFRQDIGRGFELLVSQCTQTIALLEKTVKELSAAKDNNIALEYIIMNISAEEGFIDMLRSSVSLSNEILDCYVSHDAHYMRTIYDAI